jgi:hypothetical protein
MKRGFSILVSMFLIALAAANGGGVFAQNKTDVLIRNATILTAARGTL